MFVVCIQVKKHEVMKYTGDGEPPFCMITIKPISDEITPSDLKCTVFLGGINVPNSLQLTRGVEYSSSQLCESVMHILFLCFKFCIHESLLRCRDTVLYE